VDDALVLVDPAMLAWQIIGSELRPVFSHENLYLSSMHEGIFGADGGRVPPWVRLHFPLCLWTETANGGKFIWLFPKLANTLPATI
jgi:hypothetical protein